MRYSFFRGMQFVFLLGAAGDASFSGSITATCHPSAPRWTTTPPAEISRAMRLSYQKQASYVTRQQAGWYITPRLDASRHPNSADWLSLGAVGTRKL